MRRSLPWLHREIADRRRLGARRPVAGRGGARRLGLAVLLGCLAMLALAQGASATGTGSIKGTVTNLSGAAVQNVEVTFYDASTEALVGSTMTNSNGEYELSGITEGSYKLQFSAEPEYLLQYYNKESSLANADPVHVVGGVTTENIDAKLQGLGSISGKVTSASTGSGLANIHVQVFQLGENEEERSTTTDSTGEYTIENLPAGEYVIEFFSSENNYIAKGQVTTVKEGLTDKLDAALIEGGKISGTVTDAVTHAGLAKILVCAAGSHGYECAPTNAVGQYTVSGLPTGSYKVEFSWEYSPAEAKACEHTAQCPPKYITQYYNDQPSSATANPVAATVATTTSGINAAMVAAAPVNTALPAVSGTPTVGELLSCSNGSWTGESELTLTAGWPLTSTFSYQWLRDGGAIAGATSSAYLVQSADVGHSLSCEVGASNAAGHASAKSNPIAVTLPAVSVSSAKIAVSGSSAKVRIACANAACAGTIEVSGQVASKGKKKAKKKTVALGKGSYSLASGKSATVTVKLTSAGKSALAEAKSHKLTATAVVTVTGGTTVKKAVVLSGSAPKKSKHK